MSEQEKSSTGLNTNVAGLLCYLGWWLTGLIFFLIEKENKTIRFHAMQSIITFVAVTILMIIFGFIPVLNFIFPILVFVLWIILMVKAYQGKMIKLPLVGNLADKYSNPK
jgi:uncharacterized membrane protein